jgi:hypothetical protein
MKKSWLLGVLCVHLATASLNTEAQLISADWKSPSDALITRDTSTGLDWLDLTVTINRSRDSVLSGFDNGGDLEGFRYATTDEVVSLWLNFGIDLELAPNTIPEYDSGVGQAINLLGDTLADLDPSDMGSLGMTAKQTYQAPYTSCTSQR